MPSTDVNLEIPSPNEGSESTFRGPSSSSEDACRSIVIQPGTVAPAYLNDTDNNAATQWSNRPIATLAVLFFVTGAFGIPLLWRNSNFSSWQRILWTIVVLIYTVALFTGVGMLVLHTLDPVRGN